MTKVISISSHDTPPWIMITLYHTPSKYLNLAFFRIQVYGVTKNRHNSSCATVSLAELASANVVGYTTIPIEASKFYLIGTQFKGVGASSDTIAISKLVSLNNITPGTYSTREASAPQLQIWNGSGYTKYYYISDAQNESRETVTAWANGRRALTDSNTFTLGQGFWFIAKNVESGASATFSGEVKMDSESMSIPVGANVFTIVSNPFPCDLTFDKITTKGITPGTYSTREASAPQLQVWNGSGYTKYYYISDAQNENRESVTAWANGRRVATGVAASVSGAFWVKSATEGSLEIAK